MSKEINLAEVEAILMSLDKVTYGNLITKCNNAKKELMRRNYTKGNKIAFTTKEGEKEIKKSGFIVYVNKESLTIQTQEGDKMVMYNLIYDNDYATLSKK